MNRMFKYIIPLWISMAINTLLGVTDFYFLGQISEHYLAVIGIAYVPFTLLNSLIVGIGIETNRSIANGSKIKMWKVYSVTAAISTAIIIIGSLFYKEIFFFATNNAYYDDIIIYFQRLMILLLPTSLLYVSTGVLRGNGIPGKTIWFSGTVVIFNFILDYLFIKLNYFGSPLRGCVYASIISDSIIVIIYIIYLFKSKYLHVDTENIQLTRFMKNAMTYSFEKLFSASSLTLLTGVFVASLSIKESTIYYAAERGLLPITMFSYAYFEWIIYSTSKDIKITRIKNYILYMIVLFMGLMFINSYLKLDRFSVVYCLLYIAYCLLFFIEREIVAISFAYEMGGLVNKVIFVKNVVLFMILQVLLMTNHLNLYAIGLTQITLIIVESFILLENNRQTKMKPLTRKT